MSLVRAGDQTAIKPRDFHNSLQTYDAAADVALVEYKGEQLSIDTSLLTDFQFRTASLYQFIGEIQASCRGPRKDEPPFLMMDERGCRERWGGGWQSTFGVVYLILCGCLSSINISIRRMEHRSSS